VKDSSSAEERDAVLRARAGARYRAGETLKAHGSSAVGRSVTFTAPRACARGSSGGGGGRHASCSCHGDTRKQRGVRPQRR